MQRLSSLAAIVAACMALSATQVSAAPAFTMTSFATSQDAKIVQVGFRNRLHHKPRFRSFGHRRHGFSRFGHSRFNRFGHRRFGRFGFAHNRPSRLVRALPSACRVTIRRNDQDRSAYRASCLDENFADARFLPATCPAVLRTRSGDEAFFDARCLSESGWRVSVR